jgi:ribonuclease VapC
VIVLDASAIVAIITGEPEADALTEALGRASEITTSPVAVYEATLGLVRILTRSVEDAEVDVMEFLRLARVAVQPIQPETVHVALEAFTRYGKGRGHVARLNLGDCFIYAHAKLGGASLLYKRGGFLEDGHRERVLSGHALRRIAI